MSKESKEQLAKRRDSLLRRAAKIDIQLLSSEEGQYLPDRSQAMTDPNSPMYSYRQMVDFAKQITLDTALADKQEFLTIIETEFRPYTLAYNDLIETLLTIDTAARTATNSHMLKRVLAGKDEELTSRLYRFLKLKHALDGKYKNMDSEYDEGLTKSCAARCKALRMLFDDPMDKGKKLREVVERENSLLILRRELEQIDFGGRRTDPARYELAHAWAELLREGRDYDNRLQEVLELRRRYENKKAMNCLSDLGMEALTILQAIKNNKQAGDRLVWLKRSFPALFEETGLLES